jgi:uncharacterized membrane-anchored protein YitT (DUF2179 family)
MSYPPYPQYSTVKPKRPKFLAMLAGFTISTVAGIIIGQISSLLYSLVGGIQCLTFPLTVVIFGGSTALSYFLTRTINKKINKAG